SIMQERQGAEREVQCLLRIGILARDSRCRWRKRNASFESKVELYAELNHPRIARPVVFAEEIAQRPIWIVVPRLAHGPAANVVRDDDLVISHQNRAAGLQFGHELSFRIGAVDGSNAYFNSFHFSPSSPFNPQTQP